VGAVFAGHANGRPELMQTTDYYPFGLIMAQQNFYADTITPNRYLYNGKEIQNDVLAGTSLDWFDYGARMYDAALGRWHVKDPLMEWHFNSTPYNYCFNNPINYFDPFGLDTIPSRKVDKRKFNPEKDVVLLDEVKVKGRKTSWVKKFFNIFLTKFDEGDGGSIPGGWHLTKSGQSIDPTKEKSENPSDVETIDVTDLSFVMGRAGAGRFSKGTLDAAKGLKRIFDIAKENPGSLTSDEEIVNEKTGTAEKTDANGESLKNKYFIPNNVPDDFLIPTKNGSTPYQKGDTLILDSTRKNGLSHGNKGYYKFWRIQNANRK